MELVALGFRVGLGLVFLNASFPKLLAPLEFERAVSNYRLLSPRLASLVARWLPRVELVCALALLAGFVLPVVGAVVAVLLVGFALAVASNLLRGRELDCGCSGSIAPKKIGWGLVFQDGAYAAMALTVVAVSPQALSVPLPGGPRAETLPVSDAVAVVVASTLVMLGYLLLVEVVRYRRGARAFGLRLEGRRR